MVSPLPCHSLTLAGASIEVKFAPSANGSLMMLTVKVFRNLILASVSFSLPGPGFEKETMMRGGLWLMTLK